MIQIDRDMPKNCLDCSVEHLSINHFCGITGYITDDVRLSERHLECPLVEVPDTYVVPYAFAKAHECCGGCTE